MVYESKGVELIAKERQAHYLREGFDPAHDDKYKSFELARAAATYTLTACAIAGERKDFRPIIKGFQEMWPWDEACFKPQSQLRDLVRAGALIAAEIDRVLREQDK